MDSLRLGEKAAWPKEYIDSISDVGCDRVYIQKLSSAMVWKP